MNSRQKGARIEREAAKDARQHWGFDEAKRSAQVSGNISSDLWDTPGVHFEVKGHKRIAAQRFLDQAERDAAPGTIPVVLMRENGDKDFVVMVRSKHIARIAEIVNDNFSSG